MRRERLVMWLIWRRARRGGLVVVQLLVVDNAGMLLLYLTVVRLEHQLGSDEEFGGGPSSMVCLSG